LPRPRPDDDYIAPFDVTGVDGFYSFFFSVKNAGRTLMHQHFGGYRTALDDRTVWSERTVQNRYSAGQ
jgi:hypothetical protein